MAAPARQRVQQARALLILNQPFFGVLALRLAVVEDPGCETAWTDGASLGYAPAFVDGITNDELLGVIAHEVMHCACAHMWRRDGRTAERWNVACDYAVNQVLKDAAFRLQAGALLDPQWLGKSAEWIYARLPDDPPDGADGQGQGPDGPADASGGSLRPDRQGGRRSSRAGTAAARPGAGAVDVRDAPADGRDGATEADWQQAVQQAAVAAKARGVLPASLARFAETAAAPLVDWRSVLHRFVQQASREDYCWRQPNTRYLAGGLYLPALRSETVGPIAVAVDTSGSIDNVLLAQFEAELRSVVDDVRPSRVYVIWADAKVHRIDTFERDDVVTFRPVGGGGTSHVPVMDAVDGLDEPPVALICLTDMATAHRPAPPCCPVLWAATARYSEPPYGEVVMVE